MQGGQPHPNGLGAACAACRGRSTPTLTLIDAQGLIRQQHFGQVSDLLLGAQVAQLLANAARAAGGESSAMQPMAVSDDASCAWPADSND
jgi:hypothetical protein